MLPDVLQAGSMLPMLPLVEQAVRSFSTGLLLPIGIGLAAYSWLCVRRLSR